MKTNTERKSALVLLSGGLDSATVLAIARNDEFTCTAMSFRYGQRHQLELDRSAELCSRFHIPHIILDVPLDKIGGSALTDPSRIIPDIPEHEIGTGIPETYVPARNMIFLSIAAGYCELNGITDIFIGTNAVDYSGYPDCRPVFIRAMEDALTLGTRYADSPRSFKIHTPLGNLNKGEIIRKGLELGVDYALTSTCYNPDPSGKPCRTCDACKLRARGFADAGEMDPLLSREPK